MKRIHLFEFEDLPWFPDFVRVCMTRYLLLVHKLFGSRPVIAELLAKTLKETGKNKIIDLCSGAGGPMIEAYEDLKNGNFKDLEVSLSDLYPNQSAAEEINSNGDANLSYITQPVDATHPQKELDGLRTMVCSFHHMTEQNAKAILKDAKDQKQPILIFEISDNSSPKFLWWIAFPINIFVVLLLTPMIKPFTKEQLIFTYLIPILPIAIAWDGAVSNARTYSQHDLDLLTKDLQSDDYIWEKGIVKGKGNKLWLVGKPV
ncbi:MAG: hypothetical protein KDC84_03580 [Crocinitomicaceae bacterium]|nr:hypothetical protein [Crocinitomicaceae bacterium]